MIHRATQTQVILLLGPPGVGKGSQALLIKEKMEISHISTGELLRDNIKRGTPLGKRFKSYIDAGQLAPDELIFDLLFNRIDKEDCRKGFILDGFPRTILQAEELQKHLTEEHALIALSLELPDSEIIQRLTKRLTCKQCQAPYHLLYSPPKSGGICDLCSGELMQRSDDVEEIVKKRIQVYHEKTAPLIGFYKSAGLLLSIDANRPKGAVLAEILQAVGD
ncbi:MAG: adenylate kinase [Chlamydiae bacterium]|nr:adenylate kinase [Chlamydiota bacterium]